MKNSYHYCTVDNSLHISMLILLLFFTVSLPQVYAGAAPIASNQTEVTSQSDSFRIMSFNIRYGSADDKENAWDLRKDLVFDIINEYQPQLAGVQEALYFQLEEIIQKLPEYAFIGVGRDDGKKEGEFSAILYLKDRYDVISHDTFWLSDTPGTINSKTWGNTLPRIVTWAKLEDTELNKQLYMFNTHFDHKSQPSREKSAQLIVKKVLARETAGIPAVITGDFNAGEYNSVIRYMVEDQGITMSTGESLTNPQPFKDTFRTRHPEAVKVGTANRFEGYSVGEKIDYIFVSGHLSITGATIIRDNDHGRYPSDHFPITADLAF
jgi:endonuclease/exonuclease/phosphatase family metal-dependent hydrolase